MNKSSGKICFFNSAVAWGGGEKWHLEFACELHKSGYNVIVFAHPDSELRKKAEAEKLHVVPLKVSNTSFLNPLKKRRLIKKLRCESVEQIILNLSRDLKFAGTASKKAKLKRVIYRRGSAIPVKNTFYNRFLFKKVLTDIIANTKATKDTILQNNPQLFDPEKIKVIYNGIDFEKLYALENTVLIEKKENEFVIGNLGRLEYQKAQHYLIDLAAELRQRGYTNFKIIIAGKGRLEDKLRQECIRENLTDHVIFTGFTDNIRSFFQSVDLFILTSKWEGFGYVLVEAGAFEKPVIAFNLSSNPEIIEHNKTGYLIDYPDLSQMADMTEKLMNDASLRAEFGKNGKKRAVDFFSADDKFKEFKDYIDN